MSFIPKNITLWAEIPVRDLDKGIAFYAAATGATIDKVDMGGEEVAVFRVADRAEGISANLFVGEPGQAETGPVIFLAIDGTIEDAMQRTEAAGGRVLSDIVTIPPGQYFYAADPDGNRIGLFKHA
ncbi:VOC family protein [Tropicimonas sp. IMCC34043]|uniref:VOC family protein n=1 Tax=Tropicimonas sp. IMCC34043 TaxID=2248760 RepID=UPI000E26FAD6|nr:VOC family protein [Tropicimonas sp. IMCC34043]